MSRETFISRFGTMAAIAGSAVGLGNIWKFPYVAAQNGGAAFLIIYIVITLTISIPVLMAEMSIGRSGQGDVWTAVKRTTPNKRWMIMPVIALVAAFIIMSFYNVVSGWSLEYIWQSITNSFSGADETMMANRFERFVNSGTRPIVWMLVFLLLNCLVLVFGVSKGIERCSKIMIPGLFLMLVFIAIASIPLDGWREGVEFLLKPEWSKVTGQTVISALGQSFFSLSIGSGAMMTYGSYVDRKESLFSIVMIVSLASILIALLSGLAIFPAVFTYGVELTSGPALVFVTLPPLFAKMSVGYIAAIFFFVLLFFAAITSSLSIFESLVAFVTDRFHLKRGITVAVFFVVLSVLCSLVTLSQVEGSSLCICGKNLFDWADMITSNLLMPLGGILIAVYVGWRMAKTEVTRELTAGGGVGAKLYPFVKVMLQYICPPTILIMLAVLLGLF